MPPGGTATGVGDGVGGEIGYKLADGGGWGNRRPDARIAGRPHISPNLSSRLEAHQRHIGSPSTPSHPITSRQRPEAQDIGESAQDS